MDTRDLRTGARALRIGLLIVMCFALALGAAACKKAEEPSGPKESNGPATESTSTPETETTTPPESTSTVKAYFMDGEKVAPVSGTAKGKGVAAAAMELLLAGPDAKQRAGGLSTMIPTGSKLRGVSITAKVATVDLSNEFTSGGGTLSMTGRVAQVVFTLTQFPTVDAVRFKVDGKPLDVLGGEGIILDEPRTRADEEGFAPEVLIESPTWGATVPSEGTIRVTGSANTFEGVFQLEIVDGGGKIIRTEREQATSGTGTRGTFDARISLLGVKTIATLTGSYLSAKDGTRVVVSEVPLVLE